MQFVFGRKLCILNEKIGQRFLTTKEIPVNNVGKKRMHVLFERPHVHVNFPTVNI